jgi:hypothetical protein
MLDLKLELKLEDGQSGPSEECWVRERCKVKERYCHAADLLCVVMRYDFRSKAAERLSGKALELILKSFHA